MNYVIIKINYTVCTYSTYLLARIRRIWVVIIGKKQNSLVAILVRAKKEEIFQGKFCTLLLCSIANSLHN